VHDDSFLMLFNAHHEGVDFRLPGSGHAQPWELIFDTAARDPDGGAASVPGGEPYRLQGRSMALLRLQRGEAAPLAKESP
jgi:glycogen operon protein